MMCVLIFVGKKNGLLESITVSSERNSIANVVKFEENITELLLISC